MNRKDRDSRIQLLNILLKWSLQQKWADFIPDSWQSIRIKGKSCKSATVIWSVSTTPFVFQSYIQIVTVWANLNLGYNYFGLNEPLLLKEALAWIYWKNFEKAKYADFQSLIENNTWKYKNALWGWLISTGRLVLKIKKVWWGKILKFKAWWVAHGYKQ